MTETIDSHQYETKTRHTLGMMLVKPDAIEAGIAEALIVHTFDRLKAEIFDIDLKGVVLIDSFSHEQTEQIYPDLDEKYKKAYKSIYCEGPMIVVFWSSESGRHDIWSKLKTIRGKVTLGHGLNDSIRSIIPLPGYKQKYEELSGKLQTGLLSDDDYIELSKNLVHIPENLKEFAGLFVNIPENEVHEIFGKSCSNRLIKEMSMCFNQK